MKARTSLGQTISIRNVDIETRQETILRSLGAHKEQQEALVGRSRNHTDMHWHISRYVAKRDKENREK